MKPATIRIIGKNYDIGTLATGSVIFTNRSQYKWETVPSEVNGWAFVTGEAGNPPAVEIIPLSDRNGFMLLPLKRPRQSEANESLAKSGWSPLKLVDTPFTATIHGNEKRQRFVSTEAAILSGVGPARFFGRVAALARRKNEALNSEQKRVTISRDSLAISAVNLGAKSFVFLGSVAAFDERFTDSRLAFHAITAENRGISRSFTDKTVNGRTMDGCNRNVRRTAAGPGCPCAGGYRAC